MQYAMLRYFKLDSLRWQLIVATLLATCVVWLLGIGSIYWVLKKETNTLFDQSMVETAHAVLSLNQQYLHDGIMQSSNTLYTQEQAAGEHFNRTVFQIWRGDQQLVYHSSGTTHQPIASLQQTGFGFNTIQSKRYRTYATWDIHFQYKILVAEAWEVRQVLFKKTALRLGITAVAFLPILALSLFGIISLLLKRIQHAAQHIGAQNTQQLTHIPHHVLPSEFMPLIDAHNQLTARLMHLLTIEKRFTANAAHELRTPLAAIRLHAQVLEKARSTAEAQEAIDDIKRGVDRSTRLVEQLLTLARLDPAAPLNEPTPAPLNLQWLTEEVLRLMHLQYEQKYLTLHSTLHPVWVHADHTMVETVFRNILDNAIRYSPPHAQLHITLEQEGDWVVWQIADTGPGIAPEHQQQVFERFFRLNHHEQGSGLGLSIVKSIIEHLGGRITLSPNTPTGLIVRIDLPAIQHDPKGYYEEG